MSSDPHGPDLVSPPSPSLPPCVPPPHQAHHVLGQGALEQVGPQAQRRPRGVGEHTKRGDAQVGGQHAVACHLWRGRAVHVLAGAGGDAVSGAGGLWVVARWQWGLVRAGGAGCVCVCWRPAWCERRQGMGASRPHAARAVASEMRWWWCYGRWCHAKQPKVAHT